MPDINDVHEVVKSHFKPWCTLNRLWLKHHKAKVLRDMDPVKYSDAVVRDAPELNEENTFITVETHSTEYLYGLAGEGRSAAPYRDDTPVVIVRFRGNDYLIDGGSRSTKWHNEENRDQHPAYVIEVRE